MKFCTHTIIYFHQMKVSLKITNTHILITLKLEKSKINSLI